MLGINVDLVAAIKSNSVRWLVAGLFAGAIGALAVSAKVDEWLYKSRSETLSQDRLKYENDIRQLLAKNNEAASSMEDLNARIKVFQRTLDESYSREQYSALEKELKEAKEAVVQLSTGILSRDTAARSLPVSMPIALRQVVEPLPGLKLAIYDVVEYSSSYGRAEYKVLGNLLGPEVITVIEYEYFEMLWNGMWLRARISRSGGGHQLSVEKNMWR